MLVDPQTMLVGRHVLSIDADEKELSEHIVQH
jgi:hypothetical protein